MYLYLGFLLLSIGFVTLSITNIFSYIVFNNCHTSCELGLMDDAFSLEDFSYFMYFGLSLFAYVLFINSYLSKNSKFHKIFITIFSVYFLVIISFLSLNDDYKLWYSYHEYFHLASLIIMIFISFKNVLNYNEKRSLNSFLVMISFMLISIFHLLHLFSFISGWMYVFAHISVLSGFITLLIMLLRVKK